ncbi:MAG: peptidoglycan DD-metalloendopeptidase family protein [Acetobacteraceae bacterium]|nr:peptidoglycan DD-metalloendopeptidase family protein [Acetobacteraceae bacterium]
MRHALRNSLLILPLVCAAAAEPPKLAKEQAARQQIEDAERARAAELAAQQRAASRVAAASAESQKLADQRAAALLRLRLAEAASLDAANRLDELLQKRHEAEKKLAARAEEMQPLLPLIERLSLFPAETVLAVPGRLDDTMRGLLVLKGLARQLQQEAMELRREQAALDNAAAAARAEEPRLAAARAAQATAAAELDRQLGLVEADRERAEIDASSAARRAAGQAAKAESLRGLLHALEVQQRAEEARAREEATRADRQRVSAQAEAPKRRTVDLAGPPVAGTLASISQPRAVLVAPVAGTIVHAWGEETEAGPATGISYHAAPSARVVSPCHGHVAFADRFRSYGMLVIIDCGGGYNAVLAGLEHLDAKAGQPVGAGEPLGVMPAWEPGTGRRPSLYVELRREGQPINPTPWLKASG